MSSEKFINAIGLLDDELIADAEIKPAKKNYAIYMKYTAVAASLLLIVLVAFLLRNSFEEPESKPENTLLAELDETEKPEDNHPDMTKAPVLPTELVQTVEPASEESIEDKEDERSHVEVAYGDVITPEPAVTETPVISYPAESTKEPEEVKPSEDVGLMEDEKNDETGDEILPTESPVVTETPEVDSSWTEEFVVSNLEQSDVADKTVALNFVEQLFFSSFVDSSNVSYGRNGEWWYGVKVGEVLYTQSEVSIPDNYIEKYINESLLKGINRFSYASKETKAYTYKISGVSEEAAIAVKIDEQDGYYLFANPDYRASTFSEFVQAYNLDEYSSLNALAVYDNKGTSVYTKINNENIWRILTHGESSYVDYKKLYFEHEVSATIEIDAELYGYKNVPLALYSEGYVVIYLGNINGAYYVGPDTIALVKGQIVNAK